MTTSSRARRGALVALALTASGAGLMAASPPASAAISDIPFFEVNYSAAGCNVIDVNPTTGDDRGGIAVSGSNVFNTGDSSTVSAPLALTSQSNVGTRYEALVSDLQTGTLYTLASGAAPGTPVGFNGGTVTHLRALDPVTGALTGGSVPLSTPVNVAGGGADGYAGIFAGYGMVVLYDASSSQAHIVEVPSGTVTTVAVPGGMPADYSATNARIPTESWATWGVAERRAGGDIWVSHTTNLDGSYPADAIIRRHLTSATTQVALSGVDLGDMASFTVSPTTGRWYWHYESFGGLGIANEALGYCTATTTNSPATNTDTIVTVSATTATAVEGGEPGVVTFTRTGDRFRTLLVRYSVTGTATSGTDFEALSGTVQFPYGATTVTVPVTALADDVADAGETVVVNVEFGEYTRRDPMSATVTIQDQSEPVCEAAGDAGFTDVPDDYVHAENIDCLAEYGLAEGYPDGTYRFRDPVKRGQMASFVARLLDAAGVELPASAPDAFTADDGGVHERAINQLAALGLFDGTTGEDGEQFFPWEPMRRDDMAQILVNAFEVVTGEALAAGEDAFTDDEGGDPKGTGTDNEDAINALAAVDVVEGTGGGLYDPDGSVTRGQFASFFARYMQVLADDGVTFQPAG